MFISSVFNFSSSLFQTYNFYVGNFKKIVACVETFYILSCVDSFNSFRVFDREAEGEAYAAIAKHVSADTDVNVLGQLKLHFEPQVRLCPRYNYVIRGNVRVGWSFLIVEYCSA